MRPKDVNHCVALLASHPEEQRRYGKLLEQLPSAWLKLLRAGSLNTAIVEDMDNRIPQIVALGVSVFVSDDFLRRLKTAPLAWIGPELVHRVTSGDPGVLSAKQIREANSKEGLSVAVWVGIVSALHPDQRIDVELMRTFVQEHSGYHLKELICQPLDLGQIRAVPNFGLFWLSEEGHYVDCRSQLLDELSQDPFIAGADRETAKRSFGTWFSMVFAHAPPRIYFRPAEQRLLLVALRGLTDKELADELAISLSAVKKAWRSVYDRAAKALPHNSPDSTTEEIEAKRGKEKKQHLLAYLRGHMEELRPVLPPRGEERTVGKANRLPLTGGDTGM